jgi:uncharacterized membrane protein HdeD (DUF308 family)
VEPHELILLALATEIDREAILRRAYEVRHERMVMAAKGLVGLAATILVSLGIALVREEFETATWPVVVLAAWAGVAGVAGVTCFFRLRTIDAEYRTAALVYSGIRGMLGV